MSEQARRRRLVPVAAAGLLALAGCATIPTAGPVHPGRDLQLERAEDGLQSFGQPPVPGASRRDIVLGFVQSNADFVNDHEVAREYLTPAARQRWHPKAGTVVYDPAVAPLSVTLSADGTTVTVQAATVGTIDSDGGYRQQPPGSTVTRTFRLERVGGQWRVDALTDGLLLATGDVSLIYKTASLYFLASSGATLVPDQVLVPEASGLATKLVARLLHGPSRALRGAVSTAFPQGTGLDVGSVPVSGGTARVRLDASALKADDKAREQMSAQIVWTLKQVPGIQQVRITAGGEDLAVSGAGQPLSRTAWPQYDPDGITTDTPSVYVVRAGRVGRYVAAEFKPVPVVPTTPLLRTPAVTADAGRLAAVSTDGRTLYVGSLAGTEALTARLRGRDLSRPTWDLGNNLWVVDRATGVLWYLPDGADKAVAVTLPALPGGRAVSGVSIARDGTRIALEAGSGRATRLLTGAVVRVQTADPSVPGGERLSVVAVGEPLPSLRDLRDVAWADAGTLAVLGSSDGADPAPVLTSTDGYAVQEVEALPGAVSLAAAPPRGSPLVAGTSSGSLSQFTASSGWVSVGLGSDPAYQG